MTDQFEERADDVRVLLETAPVPPAHADLARAIEAGGVVRRRRRYAAVAAATVFALAGTAAVGQALDRTGRPDRMDVPIGGTVTSTPAPFSACTVRTLAAPGGKGTLTGQVVADPTGRYAAASVIMPDGAVRAVLWTDGEPRLLPGGGVVQPRAVSSTGTVVGTGSSEKGLPVAWIYRDGDKSDLAPVKGYEWWAPLTVDEQGNVTGEAWRGMQFALVAWVHTGPNDRPVLVNSPGDMRGSGVGADGTVVGTRGDEAALYAWHADGTGRALELPPGAATGQALAVRGRWAAGWVALSADKAPGDRTPPPPAPQTRAREQRAPDVIQKKNADGGSLVTAPARWDLRTGKVTHWPERTMAATAVNASGWVAAPGDGGPTVISPEGKVTTLPGPADGFPTALSDDNRRLYGERVPPNLAADSYAIAIERRKRGEATELLMWQC